MTKAGSQMISNLFGAPEVTQPPKKEDKIWRVSEILAQAKRSLEGQFHQVAILGEISSFKPWRSGHWYFSLKDAKSSLNAIMFQSANQRVLFEVQDGLEVVAHGRVSIYPERSQVQIIVDRLEPLGTGALALAFEQLKKKLSQEGLFEAKHKKPLPSFPQRIGLVTSPQGAALRDMLRVMNNRWPGLQIILSPTRVQGQGAALEIARALQHLDDTRKCDVIVIGRGGGSLEDLWAFNEEVVARAVFKSQTPVVSAVGHATDSTITDYIADRSVATPTHSASIIPEKKVFQQQLSKERLRLTQTIQEMLLKSNNHLLQWRKRLPEPRLRLLEYKQILDHKERRCLNGLHQHIAKKKKGLLGQERRIKAQHPFQVMRTYQSDLENQKKRLAQHHPKDRIQKAQQKLMRQEQAMERCIQEQHNNAQKTFAVHLAALETLSPLAVLHRGYAMVQKPAEKKSALISTVNQLRTKDTIQIQFSDGTAQAVVTDVLPRKEE